MSLSAKDIEYIYSRKATVLYKLGGGTDHEADAEDILQLVMIRAINYSEKWIDRPDYEKNKYITMMIDSVVKDFWRKKKAKGRSNEILVENLPTDIPDENDDKEVAIIKLLELCDSVLSSDMKYVVLERFKGKRFRDIAIELDISLNTALGRYRYALIRLKKERHVLAEFYHKD